MKFFKKTNNTNESDRKQSTKVFAYRSYRSSSRRDTNLGRRHQKDSADENSRVEAFPRRNWLLVVTVVIIAGCLVSLLLLGGEPGVRLVQVEGGIERTEAASYQTEINKIWSGSLNNLTKITADTTSVEQEILTTFPELASVQIEMPVIGRRPLITLHTEPSVAILTNMTGAYYVSQDGKILARVGGDYSYTGTSKLVAVTDNSGLHPEAGEYVLNHNQMRALRMYEQGLEDNSIAVESIVLPTEINQLDIYLKKESYYIKFNFLEDVRQSIGAFIAAQDTIQNQQKPSQYIDVRVPEKVFYK